MDTYSFIEQHYIFIIIIGVVSFIILEIFHYLFGMRRFTRRIAVLAMLGYCAAVIYITLLVRLESGNYQYELRLFWTYRAIFEDSEISIIPEILANIGLFLPFGMIMNIVGSRKVRWWMNLLLALLFSATIEVLQLVLQRGLFEFDDIFHNTLGAVIGFILACCIQKMIKCLAKK